MFNNNIYLLGKNSTHFKSPVIICFEKSTFTLSYLKSIVNLEGICMYIFNKKDGYEKTFPISNKKTKIYLQDLMY